MPTPPVHDTPAYQRPEAKAALPDIHLIDDLVAGTRAMQAHAEDREYIRKWKRESDDMYAIRRTMATVFEGLGRVLTASVGMLFAKTPRIDWKAGTEALQLDYQNLDGAGTRGDVLAKRFAELALKHGLAGILVDHPTAPDDVVVTQENERALGLRPRWAIYPREAVRAWDTAVIDNQVVETLFLLGETAIERVGRYGAEERQRYRVLELVPMRDEVTQRTVYVATWSLFEERKDPQTGEVTFVPLGAGMFTDRNGQPLDRLPFAIAYTGRTEAPCVVQPPLLGVAWANLFHWRKKTDLSFYEALCGFPQPTVIGEVAMDAKTGKPQEIAFGPGVAINVAQGGDYRFTEMQGTSLEQLRQSLREALQEMAAMGLSFLVRDTRAAETAEGKRLDATAEQATITTAGIAIEDALTLAWSYHARYEAIEDANAPVVTLNKDFAPRHLDAPTLQAIVALAKSGFPHEELATVMARTGFLSTDDPDAIRALALEWQAGADAAQEIARLERDVALPDAA